MMIRAAYYRRSCSHQQGSKCAEPLECGIGFTPQLWNAVLCTMSHSPVDPCRSVPATFVPRVRPVTHIWKGPPPSCIPPSHENEVLPPLPQLLRSLLVPSIPPPPLPRFIRPPLHPHHRRHPARHQPLQSFRIRLSGLWRGGPRPCIKPDTICIQRSADNSCDMFWSNMGVGASRFFAD